MKSIDPDALLTRGQLSDALRHLGFEVAPATLATKASRGGGPPYRHFGARVLYRWGDALAWAEAKLGPVVTSTSELDALAAASPPHDDEPSAERRTQAAAGERRLDGALAQGLRRTTGPPA